LDIPKTFGQVLRRRRKDAGLTQEQLGFEAELERNFISMLELGQRQPSLTTVFKLAASLGAKPSKLVEDVEDALSAKADAPASSRRS